MPSTHLSLVERFRQTVLTVGFISAGIFQIWKRGQIFGHIRRLRYDRDWRVRTLADGSLESNSEALRNTIWHLLANPNELDGMFALLLSHHQIQFWTSQ